MNATEMRAMTLQARLDAALLYLEWAMRNGGLSEDAMAELLDDDEDNAPTIH